MRLTKTRSRIAALAGAAALAASWGAVSAPAAQAATGFEVVNDDTGWCVIGLGADKAVTLTTNLDECSVFTAENESTDMGVHWWEYKAVGSDDLCLQANEATTTVDEGGCEADQTRQLWHWPETNGEGTLQSLYSGYYAWQDGSSMDFTTKPSGEGNLALWGEPAA